MYYKVVSDGKIIDVLESASFVRYQSKNDLMLVCDKDSAEGVLSSDGNSIYRIVEECSTKLQDHDLVELYEIDQKEFDILADLIKSNDTPVDDPSEDSQDIEALTLDYAKTKAISKVNATCHEKIVEGFTMSLDNGEKYHFDMAIEDQLNINSLAAFVAKGMTIIPYNLPNDCVFLSVDEVNRLIVAASAHKISQLSYYKSLKRYIMSMTSLTQVGKVEYGMEIPEKYWSSVYKEIQDGNFDLSSLM